jgi:hypothetical protein
MSKSIRQHKHENWLNEFEIKAVKPVCDRLGVELGDISRTELKHWLSATYNLSVTEREDPRKTLAGIGIANQTLSSVLRYEIGLHSGNPYFVREMDLLINGNPASSNYYEQMGLRGLVDMLANFAKRGY